MWPNAADHSQFVPTTNWSAYQCATLVQITWSYLQEKRRTGGPKCLWCERYNRSQSSWPYCPANIMLFIFSRPQNTAGASFVTSSIGLINKQFNVNKNSNSCRLWETDLTKADCDLTSELHITSCFSSKCFFLTPLRQDLNVIADWNKLLKSCANCVKMLLNTSSLF